MRFLPALAIGVSFLTVGFCRAQDLQNAPTPETPYREQIHALAGRILKITDKAKCRRNNCTLLVANFTTATGSTSRLGIQLANSVSAELLSRAQGLQMVDRARLHEYLVREHIPSHFLSDRETARWLASEFQANAVLIGTIERLGDHLNLLVELLNVSNDKKGPQESMQFSVPEAKDAFDPFEPYDEEDHKVVASSNPPPLRRTTTKGSTVPSCIYCPTPEYTDAGRKAKFGGVVVLMVTVTADGRATDINVTKGIPFGLNEAAMKVVSTWRFKPASDGDKPVVVRVPIETSFRLY